jgi:hypothetical protein
MFFLRGEHGGHNPEVAMADFFVGVAVVSAAPQEAVA